MRRLTGSGLLLAGLFLAFVAGLAPAEGAGAAAVPLTGSSGSTDGALLFRTKGCAACHSLSAHGHRAPVRGPDLSGVEYSARRPGLSAGAYIGQSIREPAAFVIPEAPHGFDMPVLGLSDAEIDAIARILLGR